MAEHKASGPSRRHWPWILLIILAIGAGTLYLSGVLGAPTTTDPAESSADPVNTAEVVVGDLFREESFDGTLETLEGETVTSPTTGVVTYTPAAGDQVQPGEVLFEVDGEPVVVLQGAVPAYRDLTLGEETRRLLARSPGTVTWLAPVGTVLEQGDVVATINGDPVVVLYGDIPAYRRMFDARTNLEGDDILQLESALEALGFNEDGDITVDGEYTSATADLVEEWQAAIGAPEDGAIDLGEIIFLPGPAQITAVLADVGSKVGDGAALVSVTTGDPIEGEDVLQLESALAEIGFGGSPDQTFDAATATAIRSFQAAIGADETGFFRASSLLFSELAVRIDTVVAGVGSPVSPNSPVVNVSSTELVVRMDLPASDQGVVLAGDEVIVELPDGGEIGATVASVATVATRLQGAEATFEVIVELDDPAAASGFEDAPVDVEIVTESVMDVLSVPVTALIALAEGGYAVEVVGDGGSRLVAVEPGFFAMGRVEVTGDLEAGDTVVVP